MTENYVIALVGVALVAGIVFLIIKACRLFAPLPQMKNTCEFRTVEFRWRTSSEKPGEKAIYADPEVLLNVRDCAEVIFSNLTDQKITLKFGDAETAPGPLFSEIDKISLDAHSGEEFSKAFSVDSSFPPDDNNYYEFPYSIEPDGAPEEDQSPRIRVGPRSAVN